MAEVNLLGRLPKGGKRNIQERNRGDRDQVVAIAREFGAQYFDGLRDYGYGGYRYDGRWIPVAEDIVKHFNLKPGDRVLDVGCAKGFLVKDLMTVSGIEAFGLDVSHYALLHCEPETIGRLHLGSAVDLPFPDNSFKAVISLNTLHNLERADCVRALREIQRVSGGRSFVQVESYRTPEQKAICEVWALTIQFHDYPKGWIKLFNEAGYTGDYFWTIIE